MSDRKDKTPEALYRAGQQAEPPPELDARILAAAGKTLSAEANADELKPHAGSTPRFVPRWQAALASAAVVLLSVVVTMQFSVPQEEIASAPDQLIAPAAPQESAARPPEGAGSAETASRDRQELVRTSQQPELARVSSVDRSELPASAEPAPAPHAPGGFEQTAAVDSRTLEMTQQSPEMAQIPVANDAETPAESAQPPLGRAVFTQMHRAETDDHEALKVTLEESETAAESSVTDEQPPEARAARRQGVFGKLAASSFAGSEKTNSPLALRLAACAEVHSGLCQVDSRLAARSSDCAEFFELPKGARHVAMEGPVVSFKLGAETLSVRCVEGVWQEPAPPQ